MAESSKIKEFPDISSKLSAPTKKSLFERQRADAEAKRLREEAETAAVYEDFVKSFEDGDGAPISLDSIDRPSAFGKTSLSSGVSSSGGPPKRHFPALPTPLSVGKGASSGNRAVGPLKGPGSLGPAPTSISRKRANDGTSRGEGAQGPFGRERSETTSLAPTAAAFQLSEDEDDIREGKPAEHIAPKPTLQLSSLPPGTSPSVIKALLRPFLAVDNVRIMPPAGPGFSGTDRKSISAIVTLAKDTAANDIDTTVNGLQNRYLGWGFYLSLSRHLSSAALSANTSITAGLNPNLSAMPFGAKPAPIPPASSMNRAPPPSTTHRGGYGPPVSFGPPGSKSAQPFQVAVRPPSDLRQLKLIHKTLEALVTHGPDFEALLMSRPDVQQDEKWAWLWDARSVGGVWYRWRLWEIISGAEAGDTYGPAVRSGVPQNIFDTGVPWVATGRGLRFQYTTKLEEFVSGSEYDSSEDDDSGEENDQSRHHYHGGPPPSDKTMPGSMADNRFYLNPLRKAKLTHLLARLPTSNAKLRKGDVARVTAFAIEHAGEGGDEIVDMIISNIERPFAFTSANPDWKKDEGESSSEDVEEKAQRDSEDQSSSKLIGLYLISDILSSSSTSGVRHAWRYRQLFESALRQRQIFEKLGRLEKEMNWGRLRAEKWKRSVGSVLTLWEGWCVFPQTSQEHFADILTNPPPTAAEEAALSAANASSAVNSGAKSKWKAVDATSHQSLNVAPVISDAAQNPSAINYPSSDLDAMDEDDLSQVDGEVMEDVDGEEMEDLDADVDGDPMEDIESEQLVEHNPYDIEPPVQKSGKVMEQEVQARSSPTSKGDPPSASSTQLQTGASHRRRPKAEDMFADDSDEN
ncbi:MAG: hypothetical protein M1824_005143 [Vezdaea acicularis]|nr:MAG: hypothetical protein M1824_005143 [Vezdaea acicularis]